MILTGDIYPGLHIRNIRGWGADNLVNAVSCGEWVAQRSKRGWSFGSAHPQPGEKRARGATLEAAIQARAWEVAR